MSSDEHRFDGDERQWLAGGRRFDYELEPILRAAGKTKQADIYTPRHFAYQLIKENA